MDTIKLRILAEKSTLWFGKYKDMSVSQIISLGHTAYLRYIYYNYDSISFNENILKSIHIINDYYDNRIDKTGTDKQLFDKLRGIYFDNMCKRLNSAEHAVNIVKKAYKVRYKCLIQRERLYYSKGNMQRKNHGN